MPVVLRAFVVLITLVRVAYAQSTDAQITLTVPTPDALVTIDGRPVALTPSTTNTTDARAVVDLRAGHHLVDVSAPGYAATHSELVVAPGTNRIVALDLVRPAPRKRFYQQWTFWTPVVVIVAGGVATGLALGLSSTRPPIRGTLGPGVQSVD